MCTRFEGLNLEKTPARPLIGSRFVAVSIANFNYMHLALKTTKLIQRGRNRISSGEKQNRVVSYYISVLTYILYF